MEEPTYASGTRSMSAVKMVADNFGVLDKFKHDPRLNQAVQAFNFQQMKEVPMRRIVEIYISDSNPNVPLTDCVLLQGSRQTTDLSDQELFYEINIKDLLAEHNKKRITFMDKTVKDRVERLEPARIRDLKMTVVTIAAL